LTFFSRCSSEGIESARKFWGGYADKNTFPNAMDMYERMVDFYIILGFVPRTKYDEVLSENKSLRRKTGSSGILSGNFSQAFFTEGGEKVQQIWHGIIDKQLEANKEIAKTFLNSFRQLKLGSS